MAEENFKMFKDMWGEEIKKIENGIIDNRGAMLIYNRFSICESVLILSMVNFELTPKFNLEIELLQSRLKIALEIAHTRYLLQKPSFWVSTLESIARIVHRVPKP
jgi:hypothetical protein